MVENNLYLLIFIFIILGTSRASSSCGQLINRGVIERNLVRVPDIVVEDPLARVARVALEREHRALTHSSLVAHGINPHQVGTVLTTNFHVASDLASESSSQRFWAMPSIVLGRASLSTR